MGGNNKHFGYYVDEEEAAQTYDKAVIELGVPGARTNFEPEFYARTGVQTVGGPAEQSADAGEGAAAGDDGGHADGGDAKAPAKKAASKTPRAGAADLTRGALREPTKRKVSIYRGVYRDHHSKSWRLYKKIPDVSRHQFGSYRTEEQAAVAHDALARKHLGPDALCNFPEGQGPDVEDPANDSIVKATEPKKQSKYLGVYFDRSQKKWRATIRTLGDGKLRHIGYFRDEMRAARAYDNVAVALRGVQARVNFKEALVANHLGPASIQRAARKAAALSEAPLKAVTSTDSAADSASGGIESSADGNMLSDMAEGLAGPSGMGHVMGMQHAAPGMGFAMGGAGAVGNVDGMLPFVGALSPEESAGVYQQGQQQQLQGPLGAGAVPPGQYNAYGGDVMAMHSQQRLPAMAASGSSSGAYGAQMSGWAGYNAMGGAPGQAMGGSGAPMGALPMPPMSAQSMGYGGGPNHVMSELPSALTLFEDDDLFHDLGF
eukprot:PRCOL_00003095-RA